MRKSLVIFTAALIAGSALACPATARDRSDRGELSANQIADQNSARTARIKADLRLTPEQDKNWSGFENAMNDIGKRRTDREIALRDERTQRNAPPDVIQQLRAEATYLSDRSVDRKALADAAQPLFASLDDQQKRLFTEELMGQNRRARNY